MNPRQPRIPSSTSTVVTDMLNIHTAMESSSSDIALHVGNLINWFLYGVLTVQLYLYYLAFPHDRLLHKSVVGVVYFLETLHSIGLAAGLEIMMVNMNSSTVIITVVLMLIIGSLVALITQCLYAYRIRAITNMTVIPLIIVLLAALQVAAVLAAIICMPVFPIYIWIGLTVINDIIIAIVMVRALANSRGFSQETTQKIVRLISLIVETGSATAAVNILSLIFVATTYRIGDVYSAPLIILSKVYANSIMVLLNNRISIVGSRKAAPPTVKTVDISRVSEYNTMQGATLTNSRNAFTL